MQNPGLAGSEFGERTLIQSLGSEFGERIGPNIGLAGSEFGEKTFFFFFFFFFYFLKKEKEPGQSLILNLGLESDRFGIRRKDVAKPSFGV